jgi:hypothetical protein
MTGRFTFKATPEMGGTVEMKRTFNQLKLVAGE